MRNATFRAALAGGMLLALHGVGAAAPADRTSPPDQVAQVSTSDFTPVAKISDKGQPQCTPAHVGGGADLGG